MESKTITKKLNKHKPTKRFNKLILETKSLYKNFKGVGDKDLNILSNINLKINYNQRISIIGKSGSGKSTLLSLLSGLDSPTKGKVILKNNDLNNLPSNRLQQILNKDIGFVYQSSCLMTDFSALENVMMPLLIAGLVEAEAKKRANYWLRQVGLLDRKEHRPANLSGGEKQRVAIARALVNNPVCLFLDEPTGNLDDSTSKKVQNLLVNLSKKHKTTIILVTHDIKFVSQMNKVYQLSNGKLKLIKLFDKQKPNLIVSNKIKTKSQNAFVNNKSSKLVNDKKNQVKKISDKE